MLRAGALGTSLVTICLFAFVTVLGTGAHAEDDPWPGIRDVVFGQREISDSGGKFQLYAPAQAADAAIVPISIHLPPQVANEAKSLTIVIDRNPAPVAATFKFGDAYRDGVNIGERVLATRIRVDSFSKVRAILETADGKLYMVAKFVAGAGGCSALPSKDADEALANLGKTRIKATTSSVHEPLWREGIVMVRHPNFTGLQMDPASRSYTPARFVNMLEVKRGDALLLSMEGGISISEDPNLRFTYAAAEPGKLSASGTDIAGTTFSGSEADPGS